MTWENLFNIDAGIGLLPDGTKPLPEGKLINPQWGLMAISQKILKMFILYMSLKMTNKKIQTHILEGQ